MADFKTQVITRNLVYPCQLYPKDVTKQSSAVILDYDEDTKRFLVFYFRDNYTENLNEDSLISLYTTGKPLSLNSIRHRLEDTLNTLPYIISKIKQLELRDRLEGEQDGN